MQRWLGCYTHAGWRLYTCMLSVSAVTWVSSAPVSVQAGGNGPRDPAGSGWNCQSDGRIEFLFQTKSSGTFVLLCLLVRCQISQTVVCDLPAFPGVTLRTALLAKNLSNTLPCQMLTWLAFLGPDHGTFCLQRKAL